MKCMRLSTLGIGIGSIIIIGFTITLIYTIKVLCDFGKLTAEDKIGNEDVWSSAVTVLYMILVLCLISMILSGLLVAGIVKKRHTLMRPWLACAFVGIVLQGVRVLIGFFSGIVSVAPFGKVFLAFFISVLTLGIEILIFFAIHKLYKNIRDEDLSDTETEEMDIHRASGDTPSYVDNCPLQPQKEKLTFILLES